MSQCVCCARQFICMCNELETTLKSHYTRCWKTILNQCHLAKHWLLLSTIRYSVCLLPEEMWLLGPGGLSTLRLLASYDGRGSSFPVCVCVCVCVRLCTGVVSVHAWSEVCVGTHIQNSRKTVGKWHETLHLMPLSHSLTTNFIVCCGPTHLLTTLTTYATWYRSFKLGLPRRDHKLEQITYEYLRSSMCIHTTISVHTIMHVSVTLKHKPVNTIYSSAHTQSWQHTRIELAGRVSRRENHILWESVIRREGGTMGRYVMVDVSGDKDWWEHCVCVWVCVSVCMCVCVW